MGLLVECPECKKRNSHKVKACKCGFALAKFSGRVYWIEYLVGRPTAAGAYRPQ